MGVDFSNHQFFAGIGDAVKIRESIIQDVRFALRVDGFEETTDGEIADRTLIVGPPGRWIWIGDSTGSTESADPGAFEALSLRVSALGPVIDVMMSDSAAVHFYLYRDGELVDRFGNAEFPFYQFKTDEQADHYRGKPNLWSDLLLSRGAVGELRAAWVQEWRADEILDSTARLMGWNPDLARVGYTLDDEGIGIRCDEHLIDEDVDLGRFGEFHFKRQSDMPSP